jgi:3-hydroxyacyl-[acyl-carrier-protein] dehydratase
MIKLEEKCVMNLKEITNILPHRFPFLFVDKILELNKNQNAIGIKNVTANEHFFIGHFPEEPVMPGVLIIEALAQTAAILVFESLESSKKSSAVFFSAIENAKFRRPVVPGDQLILEVAIIRNKLGFWKCSGVAKVGSAIAAEAEFTAKIGDRTNV